jgi:hypothetical protein
MKVPESTLKALSYQAKGEKSIGKIRLIQKPPAKQITE